MGTADDTHSQDVLRWLSVPFWAANLPQDALNQLAEQCSVHYFDSGELCARAGTRSPHLSFIARGVVSIFRHHPDTKATLLLGVLEGPALFGDAEWAAQQPLICSVRGETDVAVVRIPNDIFDRLVRTHHGLAYQLYKDASVRHLLVNHTAQVNAFHDVPTRVLRLLLDYGGRFGVTKGPDLAVHHRIPQTAIAASLGLNRRTVFRAVEKLTESQTISSSPDGWVIHDVAALEATMPQGMLGVSWRMGETVSAVLERWEQDGAPSQPS